MNEPVEVADWLLPWWEFWHGITDALWWPAWSAMFSALALAVTIHLATSNSRRERRKDGTFIEAAAIMADVALVGARAVVDTNPHDEPWDKRLDRLAGYFDGLKYMDQMHDLDVAKFPTSNSLRNFVQLKAVMLALDDVAHKKARRTDEAFIRERIARAEGLVRSLMREAKRVGGRSVSGSTFPHHTKDAPKFHLLRPKTWAKLRKSGKAPHASPPDN